MSPIMWPRMRDDYEPGSANPGQSLVKSADQDAWEPGAEPGGGGGGGGAVDSVNGKTGTVVLSASDVGAEPAGSGTSIRNVSGAVTLDATPGLVEIYATSAATVQTVELSAGDAAVFRYLSGEWTYMVVGEHTTWQTIEAAPIPVTADAPTWTDDTVNGGGSWTTPTITGVTYSPASGTATPGQSVTVTATAQPGYTLTGTTSWTHVFPTDPGDTTDPTPGTLGYSNVTDSGFTLTVTGASDDTGLHATPYAFSLDGGTTWTGWQASATYDATDLDADTTYPCRHKVRDAALNEATGAVVNVTTAAASGGLPLTDTFTAPDGTEIVGRTVSGFTYQIGTQADFNQPAANIKPAQIYNNQARSNDGVRCATLDVGVTNVEIAVDLTTGTTAPATGQRLLISGGSGNPVYAFTSPTETKCYRYNGTTWVQVGSTYAGGIALGQTARMALSYDGTTVRVKIDGTTVISGAVAGLTGTKTGFAFLNTNASHATLDNLEVTAL